MREKLYLYTNLCIRYTVKCPRFRSMVEITPNFPQVRGLQPRTSPDYTPAMVSLSSHLIRTTDNGGEKGAGGNAPGRTERGRRKSRQTYFKDKYNY